MNKKNQNSAIWSKLPPQNLEAERSVLGSMLLEKGTIPKVLQALPDSDNFYSEIHRLIYEEIFSLFNENKPVDIVIVKEELRKKKKLKEVGGAVYLADLINSVPTTANVDYYAQIVREKYYLRKILSECDGIRGGIYKGSNVIGNVDSMVRLSEEAAMITSVGLEDKHQEYEDKLDETYARLEEMSKGEPEFPTGIYEFDQKTGGFGRGHLITVGASTAIGKTAFSTTFCMNLLKRGKKIGIFSLEMGEDEQYMRMAQMETGINLSPAKIYGMHQDVLDEVKKAMDKLKEYDLIVWDMLDVDTAIMKLINTTKRDIVIVDHIQLVVAKKEENRYRELGRIVRTFKKVAKKLKIPVVILSQLKREAEKRDELYVSDCYESGGIEQNSDMVLLLDRPAVHRHGKRKLSEAIVYIGKNRHGETGKVKLFFDTSRVQFQEYRG